MLTSQPFAIAELFFFLAGIPLSLGLIPRNPIFGFRTAKTMSNEGIWLRVNRVAGIAMLISGLIYLLVAVTLPYDRTAADNLSVWAIHLTAFTFPLFAGLYVANLYSKKQ